jgi:hypothetical protein
MNKIYVLTYTGPHETFVEAFTTEGKMRKRIEEILDDCSMTYERTFSSIEELADNTEDYISCHETELQ